MSARILFFSCEPGGAEVLIPVVRLLQRQPALEVHVASYGFGRDRFLAKGLDCLHISSIMPGDTSLLDALQPDVLATSCASLPGHDRSERHLWLAARERGIPSVAFLDQWQNYALRFSGPADSERLRFLPDFINCIDDVGEREMISEGFAPATLQKWGQPYLSSLPEQFTRISRNKVSAQLGLLEGENVALFVSEPIREHFGRSRGYDQHDAIELFFSLLASGAWRGRPVVKLHPKDDQAQFAAAVARHAALRPLLISHELTSLECIKIASSVFGMSSVMLIEAYALGRPVFSLQPHLQGSDPFVLSRLGIVPLLISEGTDLSRPPTHKGSLSWSFREEAFLLFLNELIRGKWQAQ